MKPITKQQPEDKTIPEVRPEGSKVVLLDPDVSEVFQDSESVNNALRLLIDVAKKAVKFAGKRSARHVPAKAHVPSTQTETI